MSMDIAVVIVTCNSRASIKQCLGSLSSQDHKTYGVVIVDNGSTDDTVDIVRKTYPHVRIIRNRENKGAASARNQGIEETTSRWVLTLDCDVVLTRGFIAALSDYSGHVAADIGAIQPKVYAADGVTVYSTGILLSRFLRFYDRGKGELDVPAGFSRPGYVFGACAAAALYRREMLEQIKEDTGYFDERFFFLVEDVDLSLRAQKRGWKTLFEPKVTCCHAGDSSRTPRLLRQYLCWRNRELLIRKNDIAFGRRMCMRLCYDVPRMVLLLCTNIYVRAAVLHKRKKLPEMLRGRSPCGASIARYEQP
jgi:GT2 family glycosyltransferase